MDMWVVEWKWALAANRGWYKPLEGIEGRDFDRDVWGRGSDESTSNLRTGDDRDIARMDGDGDGI